MEMASDADIRRQPPEASAPKPDALQSPPIPVGNSPANRVPIPGSTITREYKGRLLEVLVLDEGFEYVDRLFGNRQQPGHSPRVVETHEVPALAAVIGAERVNDFQRRPAPARQTRSC